jgi:putative transposase
MALTVRPLSAAETHELNQLAHARTAPHRLVQRAQIIWARGQGLQAPAMAPRGGISALRGRAWIPRVNRQGLRGVADAPRSGRPRRHDEAARGRVIARARTTPRGLGYPCALWTVARLRQALLERHR